MISDRHLCFHLPLLAILALVGCDSSIQPEAMTPALQPASRRMDYVVMVKAIGGPDVQNGDDDVCNRFWPGELRTDHFAQAVTTAVQKAALFKSVVGDTAPQYQYCLQAYLRAADNPVNSDAKARLMVRWTLTAMANRSVIWETDIVSDDKQGLDGAAKENIRKAIAALQASGI